MFPALLGLAGGILGGIGKKKQAKAEKEAYEASAQSFETNALLAELETATAIKQQKRQAYKLGGAQRVAAAGAGISTSEGGILDIMRESARNIAEDRAFIAQRGALQAQAYRAQAVAARTGAKAAGFAGKMGLISGIIGGGTEFIDQGGFGF